MAGTKISELPVATTPLTGSELVPVVQSGVTDQTTVTAILGTAAGAAKIVNTPSGTISSTTVQGAINEIVSDLAASSGGTLVGYTQGGTGAVARTVSAKLQESVSVKDFGAVGDGVTDDTAAFTAAQGSGNKLVLVPAGTYKLNNLRMKAGVVFQGDGYTATIIQQANTTNPAIYALSDASTGQLISCGLKQLRVKGLSSAGASAVKLQAVTPYVVSFGDWDFYAENPSTALEIVCGANNEVYSNTFNVVCLNAAGTSFITAGGYNIYRLEAVLCNTGLALSDGSVNSTFYYCVSDGTLSFNGQNCSIIRPSVETIYGSAAYDNCAIRLGGYDHTLISPVIENVANAKSPIGFNLFNSHTIVQPRIWGASYPNYPFGNSGTSNATIIGGDVSCFYKAEQYMTAAQIAALTFVGDTSTFTRQKNRYPASFSYVTTATYTVDANIATVGLDSAIMVGYGAGTCTITLPSGSQWVGRTLTICTRVAQTVVSASANVVPLTGGAGTAILAATIGKWAQLQYDGTNWNVLSYN